MLGFILNFIPYIGALMIEAALFLVGVVTFPTLTQALIAPLLFLAFTTLEGHFITPSIIGHRLTLNPLTVFLSLVFWTWLWGPVGAFLAVPLLIMGLVAINHMFPRRWPEDRRPSAGASQGALDTGDAAARSLDGFHSLRSGSSSTFVRDNPAWAPPVVFALAFGESLAFISLLIPAWGALVAIGALIGAGGMSFWPVWVAASLGAGFGDWVSYWIGQKLEHSVRASGRCRGIRT